MSSARVPLLFGTATMGEPGKGGARTTDLKECQDVLDIYFQHGYNELDTARIYGEGTTEQYLAKLDVKNAAIDTKVAPFKPGDHAPAALRATFHASLAALAPHKVRAFYLHVPDRSVPYEDTLREVNEFYKEGLIEMFGLSNYPAWEVAEIVGICKTNGWVQPTIYQAMYNALTREIESELVPCCRKFGIRIVVYNPLAGGLLAGKIASENAQAPEGGRFDPSNRIGQMYRARYLRSGIFDAINYLKPIAEKHQLRLTEIALRWCQHHSVLTPDDGVIIGASNAAQLEQNLSDSENGPLPEEVVKALEEVRLIVGASAPSYWQ